MKQIISFWSGVSSFFCLMFLLCPLSVKAQSAFGQLLQAAGQSGYSAPAVNGPQRVDGGSSYDSEAAAEARAAAAEARAEAAAVRQAAAAVRRAAAAEERKKKEFAKDMAQLSKLTQKNNQKAAEDESKRQEAFTKAMQPARSLIQSVTVPNPAATSAAPGNTPPPNVTQVANVLKIGGLTEPEWQEARKCQQEIERISSVWPVPGKDLPLLEQLELRRNTLWKKAVSVPGLTPSERERLRIKLYTKDVYANEARPASLSKDEMVALTQETSQRSADTPLPPGASDLDIKPVRSVIESFLTDLATEKAEEQVEKAGEYLVEKKLTAVDDIARAKLKEGEALKDSKLDTYAPLFEPIITVARVAIATKRSVASGISEGLDYAVSKITMPRAKEAIEGGQQYASVSEKAFASVLRETNNFYSKMGMGGTVDPDEFRKNMANDGNLAKKVGMRFLQWTDED